MVESSTQGTQGQYRCKKVQKILKNCITLKFRNDASEFEKDSKITKILPKKKIFFDEIQFVTKGTLFRILFVNP